MGKPLRGGPADRKALYLATPKEQILGVDVESVIDHPDVLAAIRAVVSGSIRRSMSVDLEPTGDHANGVLRFSVRPLRRDDASAAMLVVEDITQQRIANESRNTFVAQVTHELRTPLTNILLYAESVMDENEKDPHAKQKYLNIINTEARRLERIVKPFERVQVLLLSRLVSCEPAGEDAALIEVGSRRRITAKQPLEDELDVAASLFVVLRQ